MSFFDDKSRLLEFSWLPIIVLELQHPRLEFQQIFVDYKTY